MNRLIQSLGLALATGLALAQGVAAQDALEIAVVPQAIGVPYFVSTRIGAEEAAAELGVTMTYDGPPGNNVEGQITVINQAIRRGVDAIAIAPVDAAAVAPALKNAMSRGISVVTWDTDAAADARTAFVRAVSYDAMAQAMVESLVTDGVTEGPVIMVISSAGADNMVAYEAAVRAYLEENHPGIEVASVLASDNDPVKAKSLVTSYLQGYPDTAGIIVTSAAMTPTIEAVKDAGKLGEIGISGFGLPNVNGDQVASGELTRFILWNPVDLGYAAIQLAVAVSDGTYDETAESVPAGRLGDMDVEGDIVTMAPPFEFNEGNIGDFDF